MHLRALSLALSLVFTLPMLARAEANTFHAKKDSGSKISFISDAPLETMEGTSSVVLGTVSFDPEDLSTVKGTLKVPVTTIRTGIKLRDEHLVSKNWLDAKKNPYAIFEITKVKGPSKLKPNKETKAKVEGKFTVHGITRPVTADAQVTWLPAADEKAAGDQLRVKAKFPVKLEDHLISVPAIVRLKVSNDIAVEVSLRAVAE